MIYLDNAATTLQKPQVVVDAVVQAMQTMGNAARGAHGTSLGASRVVYDARMKIARLMGCPRPDHVIFTANSTEALNIALFGLFAPGDHVITTDWEHNSVLRPPSQLPAAHGVELSFVHADSQGRLDYAQFEALLKPNTKAIVCTHASNLTGDLMDLHRLGRIARTHNLLLVVDASQTAGVHPIHMEEMGLDVVCFTGHKGLLAPQGTGGLCIRPGVEIKPWKYGGSGIHSYETTQPAAYPTRLEAGTLNSHGIAGLSAALDYIQQTGQQTIRQYERQLMERFYQGVSALPGVTVYGDFTQQNRAAIVSLNLWDYDSGLVSDELEQTYGIATRPGAHCAPRLHQALGTTQQGAVRFSFSWFNTMQEIEQAIQAVACLAAEGPSP